MFMPTDPARPRRRPRAAGVTALLVAVLVAANLVVLGGLTATATAGAVPVALSYPALPDTALPDTAMPYAPPAGGTQAVEVRPVSMTVPSPATTHRMRRAVSESHREIVDVPLSNGENRYFLIAGILAALFAVGGVSVAMLRSLARDVGDLERVRRRRD